MGRTADRASMSSNSETGSGIGVTGAGASTGTSTGAGNGSGRDAAALAVKMRRVRRWAGLAVASNVLFTFGWLLAASWQGPNYSFTAHTISDMYADGAPGAWFLLLVITVCGAAVMMFAWRSVWPSLRDAGRPAAIGSVLLAVSIFGLGNLFTLFEREGCRLADAGCTSSKQLANMGGTLDATLSTLGVVALVAAGFFLAAAMARLPQWRGWVRATRWGTVGILVLFAADGLSQSANLSGLFERLLALGGAVAITVLAIGVRRHTQIADAPAAQGLVED
jgi:hypothetical protein